VQLPFEFKLENMVACPSMEMSSDKVSELKKLRSRIDSLDTQIAQYLLERFQLGAQIGKIKKQANLPLRDPRREREILKNLNELAKNFPQDIQQATLVLYRQVIETMVMLQEKA